MLKAFDVAWYAQHIALSISLHRSDNGFGYALWIDTSPGRKTEAPEVIREHERVGCMWAMICGTLCDACLSFSLARESAKGEGGDAWKRMDVSRSMEGWEDDFIVLIYALVSTVS